MKIIYKWNRVIMVRVLCNDQLLFSAILCILLLWPSARFSFLSIIGGVVKDQAEADKDTNWKQRVAMGIGRWS